MNPLNPLNPQCFRCDKAGRLVYRVDGTAQCQRCGDVYKVTITIERLKDYLQRKENEK